MTELVFGTAMFFVGHYTGRIDADKAPNATAWEEIRQYSIDAKKEIELRAISYDHEETMALIERGALDGADIESPADDKETL